MNPIEWRTTSLRRVSPPSGSNGRRSNVVSVDGNAAERRGKRRRLSTPTTCFRKSKIVLRFFLSPCALTVLPTAQGAGLATKTGARNLEQNERVLAALQAADFPQNGQMILWNCLEKKARNMEMFGIDLEERAARRVPPREEASRRTRSVASSRGQRESFKRKPHHEFGGRVRWRARDGRSLVQGRAVAIGAAFGAGLLRRSFASRPAGASRAGVVST